MRRLFPFAAALPLFLAATLVGQAPASAATPSAAKDWRELAVGAGSACGIRTTGTLWCWGSDSLDALGNGPGTVAEPVPRQIGTATDWTRVALAGHTSCGLRSALLFCWGPGSGGTLGAGASVTAAAEPAPVRAVRWVSPAGFRAVRWTDVSPGGWRTCATGSAGEGLWCWGLGTDGLLGNGLSDNVFSPTRVAEGTWRSVSTGHFHTCAIEGTGALWCWGSNRYGQVGDGTTLNRPRPVRIGHRTDWASVSAGGYYTCALTTSGERRCWGMNSQGQLGDGSTTDRRVPSSTLGSGWANVSAGDYTACGTTTSGRASCWGSLSGFSSTPGTALLAPVPRQVGPAGASWTDLEVGRGYNTVAACGRQGDGSAWCFGVWGPQLGTGGTTPWIPTYESPVPVLG